ncbi:MAG: hypothetical protein NVSMB26_23910 [Beijerinckiaceae bacterium]
MPASRELLCVIGLMAALSPAAAEIDLSEAKQLIVRYRTQWIADPDKIRDARIGEPYAMPFVGTGVCVAIDRMLATGGSSGLKPLLVVVTKTDVTPAQAVFGPPPNAAFDVRVTASPALSICGLT